jgi:O-antigen ligase
MKSNSLDPAILRVPRTVYYLGMLLVAEVSIRPLGLTLSDCAFLLCLVITVPIILGGGAAGHLRLPRLFGLGVLLFVAGAALSSIVSLAPGQSIFQLFLFIYVTVAWFWLGSFLIRTRRQLYVAALCWIGSCAVVGISAVLQLYVGALPGTAVLSGRFTGFTQHPNDIGTLSAIALIPALALASSPFLGRTTRLICWPLIGAISVGLTLSGSVTAYVAVAVGLLVFVFVFHGVSKAQFLIATVLGSGLLLFFANRPNVVSLFDRISQVTAAGDSSGYFRVLALQASWNEVQQNPIVGVGLDLPSQAAIIGGGPHAVAFEAWVGAGLLGILGVVLIHVSILREATALLFRRRGEYGDHFNSALWVAFLIFMICGISGPYLYVRFGWIAAALVLSLRAVHSTSQDEVPREPASSLSTVPNRA